MAEWVSGYLPARLIGTSGATIRVEIKPACACIMSLFAESDARINEELSWPARLMWLGANLVFGVIPALLFFVWVEQDASLDPVARRLGWPWVDLGIGSAMGRCLWDVGLFFLFGLMHSSLAQVGVQAKMRRVVPAAAIRTLFLMATGTALFLMMGFWQSTGRMIWRPPVELPEWAEAAIRGAIFAVPAAVILGMLVRLGFFEFLGWAQLVGAIPVSERTAGTPRLRTGGIYGCVRHPIYTGLLAIFVLGPTLSLDRLTLFLAATAYLWVGIPVEERKLIQLFGEPYLDYRRRVPALLPHDGAGFVAALGRMGASLQPDRGDKRDRLSGRLSIEE